jgi:LysM domain-containing protein
VNAADRRRLARVAAPVAFLLGMTVAILLVRAAVGDDEPAATPATTAETRPRPPRTTTSTRPRRPRRPATQVHVIESGDTYLTIADEYDTSVARLLQLNPNVDPNALVVGQRIRVPRP